MYQVVEFFNYNPDATIGDAVSYFEKEFEIGKQVTSLKTEADEVARIRGLLRPLYKEKSDLTEKVKYVISDIETEIYMTYPPRQGSDAQREALRNKLKREKQDYIDLDTQLKNVGYQIMQYEDELNEVERRAKNARRLTELLQAYILFINEYIPPNVTQELKTNNNIF